MKNILVIVSAVILLTGCTQEFNTVYKRGDSQYKYEYAKECFARGKYSHAITLLQEVVTLQKGTENGQECLYMLAMAEYMARDYETASEYFKKYCQSYPKGIYAEMARFYVGQSLYMSTPEPRLDQSQTLTAITAFQEYLDLYPEARMKDQAQDLLLVLQDKLVTKELYSAQLYYNLGSYFGNIERNGASNYESCIITAQNALKDYPYTDKRENFAVLIMKSKYELAVNSVEERKLERYQDAEDECYGFINQFPDSDEKSTAEKYIKKCKEFTNN